MEEMVEGGVVLDRADLSVSGDINEPDCIAGAEQEQRGGEAPDLECEGESDTEDECDWESENANIVHGITEPGEIGKPAAASKPVSSSEAALSSSSISGKNGMDAANSSVLLKVGRSQFDCVNAIYPASVTNGEQSIRDRNRTEDWLKPGVLLQIQVSVLLLTRGIS